MRKNSEGAKKWRGIDGVVKNPICCIVVVFYSFGMPHAWLRSQKSAAPWL